MRQARFLVIGELVWHLSLRSVVLDNLLTGQAQAGAWQSGVGGSAFEVAQALSRARHQLAIAATVGDDVYGRLIINQIDLAGIDSDLVAIGSGIATKLRCDINQGKKDSLTINYSTNYSRAIVDLESSAQMLDWVYLAEGCGDLRQISEWLHQATIYRDSSRQLGTVLQISQLDNSEWQRFGYLLEDVDILITTAVFAQKLTGKSSPEEICRVLLGGVKTVLLVAKKRLVLATVDRLASLETTEISLADFNALGGWVVAHLTLAKQPDSAQVLAAAWQAVSDKKYSLREKSL